MTPDQFHLPAMLDYMAVVAWAVSGALVGARKGFDLVGVFMTALVSSLGGGLLRDGLLLQTVPPVLTKSAYLPLLAISSGLALIIARRVQTVGRIEKIVELIDAAGTPAFAVVGVEAARAAGVPLPGVLFVGCVSGIGGGVLRDVLVRETPEIMLPGRYLAILVALFAALYMILTIGLDLPRGLCAWGVVAAHFAVRWATIRYDWRTKPVMEA